MTKMPESVSRSGERLYSIVDASLCSTLQDLVQNQAQKDRTSALYTAVMAAAAPLAFISRLIAQPDEGEDNTAQITHKELPLIAGLILGRVIQLQTDHIKIDFNGRNILAAVEAASKVAGYDVKPFVQPQMIECYQSGMVEDGKDTLGYWDYLPQVTPDFNEFAKDLKDFGNFSKSRH